MVAEISRADSRGDEDHQELHLTDTRTAITRRSEQRFGSNHADTGQRQQRGSGAARSEEEATAGSRAAGDATSRHYEKPSEKRAREKAEGIRRARKLAQKKLNRELGIVPAKSKPARGQ